MAQVAKKTASSPKSDEPTPLEHMPPAPKKAPKSEHLFIAWTGKVDTTASTVTVTIDDLRVFGRKDQCTEFAVDQEPAWKWVQTAKGESVKDAIRAKIEGTR